MLPSFADPRLDWTGVPTGVRADGKPNFPIGNSAQRGVKINNIIPVASIIDGAGDISNTLQFNFKDGYRDRLDNVRTVLKCKMKVTKDGTVQLDDINGTYLIINCLPALFSSIRHSINDKVMSHTIFPAQDDTLIKRITKSQEYLKTLSSVSNWVVDPADRLDHVSSDAAKNDITSHTRDYVMNFDSVETFSSPYIFPPGLSHLLELNVPTFYEKRIFQATSNKVEGTNYKLDVLEFQLRLHYITISVADRASMPSTMTHSFKGFKTSSKNVSDSTTQSIRFTIPRNAKIIIVYFQHTDINVSNIYSPTEFKCGATEDVKLTELSMTYDNKSSPAQGYKQQLVYGTIKVDVDAYMDNVNALRLYNNDAGGESIYDWGRLGRYYTFAISEDHGGGDATIDLVFGSAPTSGDMKIFMTTFTDRFMVVKYEGKDVAEVLDIRT